MLGKVIVFIMIKVSKAVRANTEAAEYDEYVSFFIEEGKEAIFDMILHTESN